MCGCGQWSSELEDQEKVFMQQAKQVNTWDGALAMNGEKVIFQIVGLGWYGRLWSASLLR